MRHRNGVMRTVRVVADSRNYNCFPPLNRVRYGTNCGKTVEAVVAKSIAVRSAISSEMPTGTVTRTIAPFDLRRRTLSKTV